MEKNKGIEQDKKKKEKKKETEPQKGIVKYNVSESVENIAKRIIK